MKSYSSLPSSQQLAIEEQWDPIPQVNWELYQEAGLLTPLERKRMDDVKVHVTLFQQYQMDGSMDSTSLKQLLNTVQDNLQEYIELIIKLLYSVHQEETLKNVLHLTSLLLDQIPTVVSQFFKVNNNPFSAFLRLLNKGDRFILEKSYYCLTCLFLNYFKSNAFNTNYIQELRHFIDNIALQLQNRSLSTNSIVHSLSEILKIDMCRSIFYETQSGIPQLITLLKQTTVSNAPGGNSKGRDVQLIYEIVLCFWLLSFSKQTYQFFSNENIVPRLHDILRKEEKEKVIRVTLACLKNLMNSHSKFITDMVQVSVPKTLSMLQKRKFEDTDIQEDLVNLYDTLDRYIEELSSFDEYRQEVLSGRLQWSPVHDSEKFWKENLAKLEQNNFYIVRELIKLLYPSSSAPSSPTPTEDANSNPTSPVSDTDVLNMAIACHDLGEFVRFHPRGKKLLTELGAKTRIIQLMEANQSEVKKHALLATQKIMIQNWQNVQ